jgi:hypothetical protein
MLSEVVSKKENSLSWNMVLFIIALSQVRYAANYTTPGAILADVVPLGQEVVKLKTEGTFEEVWNAYVGSPSKGRGDPPALPGWQ